MRLHRLWLVGFVTVVLAGCGGSSSSGDGGADPAQAIPPGAALYVEGAVRPDGDQGDAARALIAKFMPPGQTLEGLIDKSIQEDEPDKSYAKDVKPWLGERVGVGFLDFPANGEPTFVAVAAVTDAKKAEDLISSSKGAKKDGELEGATVYKDDDTVSVVKGDYLLLSQSRSVLEQALKAADGDSLADSQTFEDAVGELPEERLGALYLDMKTFGEMIAKAPGVDPAGKAILDKFFGGDAKPLTAALTATDHSATIESRFSGSGLARLSSFGLLGGTSTELVEDAPADAFAVFGAADVGSSLKGALDLFGGAFVGAAITGQLEQQTGINLDRDLFSWIGDLAVYVRGDSLSTLNGAVVFGVKDEKAAAQAVPRLVAAAKRSGAPVERADVAGADQAFAVAAPGAPGPVVLAQGNGRVALAFGEDAAAEALKPSGDTLGDSSRFAQAKEAVDGLEPSLVLSLPTVFKLVEASGQTDSDYAQAKPYLDKLDLVVTGSEKDGDTLRSLFTVTTR